MVSVVILAYNRSPEVIITIGKMKELGLTLPFATEIIVVDNGSVDDTSAMVKELHPDVKLITRMPNKGIAGWNDGFAVAKYKYLLVLDDDSHIESGLTEAIQYMEANPTVGTLALNVTTGPFITEGIWKDGQDLIGFVGCGAIIKKEVYDKVGGFGEWLYVYGHEWEFGIRVIDAGYSIKYFSNSNVIHRASSVNRSVKRLLTYSMRNETGMVYKYFGDDRWKYIRLMFFNTLKRFKDQGVVPTVYNLLGFVKFYQMRKQIEYTPVSAATQKYFSEMFWGTQPFFGFLNKKKR